MSLLKNWQIKSINKKGGSFHKGRFLDYLDLPFAFIPQIEKLG